MGLRKNGIKECGIEESGMEVFPEEKRDDRSIRYLLIRLELHVHPVGLVDVVICRNRAGKSPGIHQEFLGILHGIHKELPGIHWELPRNSPGINRNSPGINRNSLGINQVLIEITPEFIRN